MIFLMGQELRRTDESSAPRIGRVPRRLLRTRVAVKSYKRSNHSQDTLRRVVTPAASKALNMEPTPHPRTALNSAMGREAKLYLIIFDNVRWYSL